jgi:hypothetical protein
MLRWTLAVACTAMLVGQVERSQEPGPKPVDSQPATLPADTGTTLRKPAQANILRNLLGQRDRLRPIQPRPSEEPSEAGAGVGPDGLPLLLEGTFLVERPGRLMREDGRAVFVFRVDADSAGSRSMPMLENQLLETMEREAKAGFSEFIISAEVTRYRGRNFLLLRKVLRRVGHGNIGP